jgi:F-type H+-transporting ATPase subunit delta
MSSERIAHRYAKSLLDLATEHDGPERIFVDAASFVKAAHNRDLALMLKSPIVPTDKKSQALEALFGSHFAPLTMKFINLIVSKSREAFLPQIMEAYQVQYRLRNKISQVRIHTAAPLGDANLAQIKQKISEQLPGQQLDIIEVVNPDLIGGFVIDLGDKQYDASIAHQLDKLRKSFNGNAYQPQI